MANRRRLAELGMVTGLAAEVASQIATAAGITAALRGQFTLNGATNVVVANTNLAAGDQIVYTMNTPGGTVGTYPVVKVRTNATGFQVAGSAPDTSIYDYRILKA
jgi:hypothetical protein